MLVSPIYRVIDGRVVVGYVVWRLVFLMIIDIDKGGIRWSRWGSEIEMRVVGRGVQACISHRTRNESLIIVRMRIVGHILRIVVGLRMHHKVGRVLTWIIMLLGR